MIYRLITSKGFLLFLFPFSVLVDLVNGYLQLNMRVRLPIGMAYRSLIFCFMVYSLARLRERLFRSYLLILVVLFGLALLGWGMSHEISYRVEMENLMRVAYLFLMIALFKIVGDHFTNDELMHVVANYGFLIASCICLSYLTGFGHLSYSEDYGFGTKSFFIAGNDLSLTLVSSSFFASYTLFSRVCVFRFVRLIVIIVGCVLIGTRVGTVGGVLTFLSTTGYYLFVFKEQKWRKVLFLLFVGSIMGPAIYTFGAYVYGSYDDYTLKKYDVDNIVTARDFLTIGAKSHIDEFNGGAFLFGEGAYSLFQSVASVAAIGQEQRVVEADYYEIIGSYGYFLGGLVLLPFCYYAINSVVVCFQNRTYMSFCLVSLLVSFVVVSFLSGHGIKNMMVAPVYGVTVLLLSRNRMKRQLGYSIRGE